MGSSRSARGTAGLTSGREKECQGARLGPVARWVSTRVPLKRPLWWSTRTRCSQVHQEGHRQCVGFPLRRVADGNVLCIHLLCPGYGVCTGAWKPWKSPLGPKSG